MHMLRKRDNRINIVFIRALVNPNATDVMEKKIKYLF